ncbi:MAG: bifunctional hydroxymethylpyrimidine kinase/phosphomethylpyrimidine kinase [Thermoplasmata archaeon]
MDSVLVVAGSDSGGGAGIQADLKALASIGVHGCTAITCITAQNTRGVVSTFPLPVEVLRNQMRAVLDDIEIRAVKTGMLYSEEIVEAVAMELEGVGCPIVVDPVMIATAGSPLHTTGFVEALVKNLLPMTTVVTPNIDEAEALTGLTIANVDDMNKAAERLAGMGSQAALVKGGHLRGELVDVLYDGEEFHSFPGHRYSKELHGSGCAYASTIAGYLAKGLDVVESVRQARRKIAAGFDTSYGIGKGFELLNSAYVEDRWVVLQSVQEAVDELLSFLPQEMVPEVGINLGYAVPGAQGYDDVCAVRGRIVRSGDKAVAVGPPAFGASRHVARVILTVMTFDPSFRSAMNVGYTEELVKRFRAAGLALGTFDRALEPAKVSTMEWGTQEAVRGAGEIPDAIYDLGGPGKVAMLRILGRTPEEVVDKLRRVVASS